MNKKTFHRIMKYNTVLLVFVLSSVNITAISQMYADSGQDKSTVVTSASLPPIPVSSSQRIENTETKKLSSQNLVAVKDTVPPVVNTDLKSTTVNDQNLFFSGEAHDDSNIARLFINQSPLAIRPGKHIFFNHLLTLNEGENTITIKAVDMQGNETQFSPVKITRKTFDFLETDNLYTVALLPLRIVAQQTISSEALYSMLIKAFDEEPKRFNLVERDRAKLEEILHEQKISNTELASPDTAIKIGKIRAAEGVFFGSMEEDAAGIHITLQLVDTETTRVLASASVSDEDKSLKNLEWLLYGLSLKMKRQFPMVQGNVIGVSGNGFHIDAGARGGIVVGMKLILFRKIKEGDFVLKEPLDTVARVVRVRPKTAFARISIEGTSKIEKRDLVITK